MNPLRNPNINYHRGWFFVTFQVAMNKSVFGVISDKRLIHNSLGERRLWADNFYGNLVSEYQELQNVRNYTLKNPERWEDDRFGPVTTYQIGNIELLSEGLVAFVASDTHDNWRVEKPHLREVNVHGGGTDTREDGVAEKARIKGLPLVSTFSSIVSRLQRDTGG